MRPIVRHNLNLDRHEIARVLAGVLSRQIAEGEETRRFEDELADYHGMKYAVTVNSGRAAMYAILKAFSFPKGGEVILPSYSFYTVPMMVETVGLKPVFSPCHPLRYALKTEEVERRINDRTVAVIVEHPFGQMAPVKDLEKLCQHYGIPLIEDSSQSIGASGWKKKAGAFGAAACMSFVHGKNLTTFGGGAVLTNDEDLYRKILTMVSSQPSGITGDIRKTALSGLLNSALTSRLGYTAGPFLPFFILNWLKRERLDALFVEKRTPFEANHLAPLSNLQAALGRDQLARLDARNLVRRENAQRLMEGLSSLSGVRLPELEPGTTPTFNAFPVRHPEVARLQQRLMKRGVDTRADYMSLFAFESEWEKEGGVCYLPCHPGLNRNDMDYVVESVEESV